MQDDYRWEQEYYIQMQEDLRADVGMALLVAHQTQAFDGHADYLWAALEDTDFVIRDPNYFILSVARAGYTRFPVITRRTFDELESVGGFILLRDRSVKKAILDYCGFASECGNSLPVHCGRR